jgi:uncharacterized protein
MKLEGRQKRLTVFIGDSDRHGHRPWPPRSSNEPTRPDWPGCRFSGAWRATAPPKPHPQQSDDPPMAVIIVDSDERIQPFLPQLDELITEGQVIVDDVEVVKYVGRRPT